MLHFSPCFSNVNTYLLMSFFRKKVTKKSLTKLKSKKLDLYKNIVNLMFMESVIDGIYFYFLYRYQLECNQKRFASFSAYRMYSLNLFFNHCIYCKSVFL